eukprot:jgi/Picre1/34421/NNA_001890.t1
MTLIELREAYDKRIAWRECQVLQLLGCQINDSIDEPVSKLFSLSSSERLQAVIAGYRPSKLHCFKKHQEYLRFVASVQGKLNGGCQPNGVLLDALEYHGVNVREAVDKASTEEMFRKYCRNVDKDILIYLQGKYELSSTFIFTRLVTNEVMRKVFVKLHDGGY